MVSTIAYKMEGDVVNEPRNELFIHKNPVSVEQCKAEALEYFETTFTGALFMNITVRTIPELAVLVNGELEA